MGSKNNEWVLKPVPHGRQIYSAGTPYVHTLTLENSKQLERFAGFSPLDCAIRKVSPGAKRGRRCTGRSLAPPAPWRWPWSKARLTRAAAPVPFRSGLKREGMSSISRASAALARSAAPPHRLPRRDQSGGQGRQHIRHGKHRSRQPHRAILRRSTAFADEAAARRSTGCRDRPMQVTPDLTVFPGPV
jgi:hypothetical protein